MRTLSPSPLITSPGNILPTDASQCSALTSSPLILQLICAKNKYSVEYQTDDMHLKTKDELVGWISELTSRQAGLVVKIQELTRPEKIISTIRVMEEGVQAAKENPQYAEFLEIKNQFTFLSEEENNHVPTHEIASPSTENTLQLAPETQQISATELNGERCKNLDVAATHPPTTGDCGRAPLEGRPN
ncbi:hypothetical protein J6590_076176 [Homalodisca vitripennis]|nr:hypothetical protein J6590_076176 [Homalodisca vitripennis]